MTKPVLIGWPKRPVPAFIRNVHRIDIRGEWWRDADVIKRAPFVWIWNGRQYHSRLARDLCVAKRIPHVFFEFGLLGQERHVLLDDRGFCGDSSICDTLDWITQEHLQHLDMHRRRLQNVTPLNPNGSILVPLQIENDSQILYHTTYRSMGEFVEDVLAMFRGQDIVVRSHPKSTASPNLPAGVRRCIGSSFFDSASMASMVVGLTSTTLVEATILGVPAIALGDHPLRSHRAADHDKVAAAYLARNVRWNAIDASKAFDTLRVEYPCQPTRTSSFSTAASA